MIIRYYSQHGPVARLVDGPAVGGDANPTSPDFDRYWIEYPNGRQECAPAGFIIWPTCNEEAEDWRAEFVARRA